MHRVLAAILLLAGCGATDTPPAADPPASAATAAGHALLARHTELLLEYAEKGEVESATVGPEIDRQLAEARALRERGELTDEFVRRHRRMLTVTRMALGPGDPATRAILLAEIETYVRSIDGAPDDIPGAGLAILAPALFAEAVNLHMLLDGVVAPAAAREAYEARYRPRP